MLTLQPIDCFQYTEDVPRFRLIADGTRYQPEETSLRDFCSIGFHQFSYHGPCMVCGGPFPEEVNPWQAQIDALPEPEPDCPVCGSLPGERCRSLSSRLPMSTQHPQRGKGPWYSADSFAPPPPAKVGPGTALPCVDRHSGNAFAEHFSWLNKGPCLRCGHQEPESPSLANRVMRAIAAAMENGGEKPRRLYLGRAEQRELDEYLKSVPMHHTDPISGREEFMGLWVVRTLDDTHMAVEAPSRWALHLTARLRR